MVAGLAVMGLATLVTLARSRAWYFSDALAGPNSPKLSIPAGKYGYTPLGLRRNQSDDDVDRPMVRTVSGAYLQLTHFTAEVTVTMAPDDIAFIGFGQGAPDRDYFNEPSGGFLFRIHNVGYSAITAAANCVGGEAHFLDNRLLGTYVPGTTEKFRIVRAGDYVTLALPRQNVAQTYSISQYNAQLHLTPENTCLFFGNTGVGTVFSDFRITPATADSDSPPPNPR